MFNYQNIHLKLLGLTLFTTLGLHNLNEASAKLVEIEEKIPSVSSVYESNEAQKLEKTVRTQNTNISPQAHHSLNNYSSGQDGDLLIASADPEPQSIFDLDSLAIFNSDSENDRIKGIRTFSLYLFLLLFVPFGIFYPFFLFYRRLLNNNWIYSKLYGEKKIDDPIELEDNPVLPPSITSFTAASLRLGNSTDDIQAVVSKLQIAFAVEDDSLRQKLVELCSNVDSRTDQGITELMRKTISLLINEENCTHVSQSSKSYSINRIKKEFETICTTEKNKVVSETYSVVGGENNNKSNNNKSKPINPFDNKDVTHYMVITLVLCTSHLEPIFSEITTKSQLSAELSELGKMRHDDLIKFDLLWNPQSEERYLTNNELLMNYIDMIRLF